MRGKAAKKVMVVGRATTFMVGLAMILALTVGLASTALAGTGIGARFQLGQTNTVNAVTKLVGSVVGSSLVIDNNSTRTGATALDLQVEPGKAPMKVNSDAKVANLNSDELDNQDSSAFVKSAYRKWETTTGGSVPGYQMLTRIYCDEGDFALGGGFGNIDTGTEILGDYPITPDFGNVTPNGWQAVWRNDATLDEVAIFVVCADVGTPHQ